MLCLWYETTLLVVKYEAMLIKSDSFKVMFGLKFEKVFLRISMYNCTITNSDSQMKKEKN